MRFAHTCLVLSGYGVMGLAADEEAGLLEADHLGAGHAAKGAQGGKEVNRLQDVRFALCIVAEE